MSNSVHNSELQRNWSARIQTLATTKKKAKLSDYSRLFFMNRKNINTVTSKCNFSAWLGEARVDLTSIEL